MDALPVVGMATVREPGVTPKSPVCVTLRFTVMVALGAGLAVTVNVALLPSVTAPASAVMETVGVAAGVSAWKICEMPRMRREPTLPSAAWLTGLLLAPH